MSITYIEFVLIISCVVNVVLAPACCCDKKK